MIIGKKGRSFRQQIKEIVGKTECSFNKLSVKIIACPPDKRRRDLDNLLKATLDALQHAGVYKDDCQIDDLHISRGIEEPPGGKLIVYIKDI
jgi:crossover junction endodeoxyribonuclease RusA